MENNYNCKKKCQNCQFWSVNPNYSHKESVRTSQVSGLGKKEIKTQFVSQMAKILHHSQFKNN